MEMKGWDSIQIIQKDIQYGEKNKTKKNILKPLKLNSISILVIFIKHFL